MRFINPFKGLRPNIQNNSKNNSIVIPSTDHLSKEIINDHKKNIPWSFLHVLNPNTDNSLSEKEVKNKAKQQFELMKKNNIINKDEKDAYYIYKISSKDHTQTGIIGTTLLK